MIRTLFPSLALSLLGAACAATDSDTQAGKLRHVVLFQFQETATPEQVAEIEDAFRALPAKIPEIHDFEWGTDVSVENLTKGFTHCFLVTFEDEAARGRYLPHPAHEEFVKLIGPVIGDVLVIDYQVEK